MVVCCIFMCARKLVNSAMYWRQLSTSIYCSGFQTGVRGPKGVRDGFPRGPREDSEK